MAPQIEWVRVTHACGHRGIVAAEYAVDVAERGCEACMNGADPHWLQELADKLLRADAPARIDKAGPAR